MDDAPGAVQMIEFKTAAQHRWMAELQRPACFFVN